MIKFKLPKPLIVLDLETSGTDTEISSIIQIGAYIISEDGILTNNSFEVYIKPYTDHWKPEAEKVHKIKKSFLMQEGFELENALDKLEKWIGEPRKYTFTQWGNGFDTEMLRKAYIYLKKPYPFCTKSFDIASIIKFDFLLRGLKGDKNLENCANSYGIKVKSHLVHNARYDAFLTGLLFEKFIRSKINSEKNSMVIQA